MEKQEEQIPKATLETLARSFFKEASTYGFKQMDYVRYVNMVLDCAMGQQGDGEEVPKKADSAESSKQKNREINESTELRLPLMGERIKIRGAVSSDDPLLFGRWLQDEIGRHFLLSRTTAKPLNMDQFFKDSDNILGIITLPDDTPIGAVAYLDYDAQQHKAELRKLIGESDMRGKGYAKEATALWIRYGYSAMCLKKIYLNTFETNIRNIKLNEELGFRVEGILRNEVFVDGEYKDVLRMGLWKD